MRITVHASLAGEGRFLFPSGHLGPDLLNLLRGERTLPHLILPGLIGIGNAFPLIFKVPVGTQPPRPAWSAAKVFVGLSWPPKATPRQLRDDAAQVIHIAGRPVHAVNNHGVALADVDQQLLQLSSLGILAAGFVLNALLSAHADLVLSV